MSGADVSFPLIRLIGGPAFFAPALPGWVILCGGWLYAALIFYFIMLVFYELAKMVFCRKYGREKKYFTDVCSHLVILFVVVIIVTVGVWNAVPVPKITSYQVEIAGLPETARGLKIAVLADLHADPLTGKKRIAGMVEKTMEQNRILLQSSVILSMSS